MQLRIKSPTHKQRLTNYLENSLLDFGFGWTLSKLLPYLLFIALGVVLLRFSLKLRLIFWLRFPVAIILLLLPFCSYFFFYPIYQPDIFNTAYKPKILPQEKPAKTTLAVVVLPGCPYCLQTAEQMNRLAEQNKKLQIVYYFVSEDPSALKLFRSKLHKRIRLKYSHDATLWMLAAEGVFPSYLLFDHQQLKRAWHNTTFGVRALDELSSYQN
ncbi:MAG: TlpA family protein disulfide reductase [Flavobacteriales bacterium]